VDKRGLEGVVPSWSFELTPLAPVEPIAPAVSARPAAGAPSFDDHLQRANQAPPAPAARSSAQNTDAPAEVTSSAPADRSATQKPAKPHGEAASESSRSAEQAKPNAGVDEAESAEADADKEAADAVIGVAAVAERAAPPVKRSLEHGDPVEPTAKRTDTKAAPRATNAKGEEKPGVAQPATDATAAASPKSPAVEKVKAKSDAKAASTDAKQSEVTAVQGEAVVETPAEPANDAAAATALTDQAAAQAAASTNQAAVAQPAQEAKQAESEPKTREHADSDTTQPSSAAAPEAAPVAVAPAVSPSATADSGARREPAAKRGREPVAASSAADASAVPDAAKSSATLSDPKVAAATAELPAVDQPRDSATAEARPADAPAPHGEAKEARGEGASRAEPNDRGRPILSTAARATGGEGTPLSDIDRVRFVQRVARAFHHVGDTGGEVRLRLSPPELGVVHIEVAMREGVMSARLEAETPAARALLYDNLPALREKLSQQDVRIEKFDIELLDRQSTGQDNTGQGTASDREQSRSAAANRLRRPATTSTITGAVPAPRAADAGRLNVVI